MRTLLAISGSTRAASTNTAVCRTAAAVLLPGVDVRCDVDLVALPAFVPEQEAPPVVRAVLDEIASAEAVLICSPEYAGTLPGTLKNLLDWAVGAAVLRAKPVACVRVAADPRRGLGADQTLRSVLAYVEAVVVEPASRHLPVGRSDVGPDGLLVPSWQAAVAEIVAALLNAAAAPPAPA